MGGSEDGRMRGQALPGRPNRFEVDLGAIAHNAATIRRLVGPSCKIFAALKADAYGYGIAAVAPAVAAAGVDGISLVSVADAVSLRQRGVEAPILLYPGVPLSTAGIAAIDEHALMPTVLDLDAGRALSARARRTLRVFVKIDVGLERLGIAPAVQAWAHMPRGLVHAADCREPARYACGPCRSSNGCSSSTSAERFC